MTVSSYYGSRWFKARCFRCAVEVMKPVMLKHKQRFYCKAHEKQRVKGTRTDYEELVRRVEYLESQGRLDRWSDLPDL